MTEPAHDADDPDDAIIARVSDYLDGALDPAARAEVAGKLASDPAWQRVHRELCETRDALSGLRRASAPASFVENVTETIHQRSAGRFFARRTLGDRVPFGALLVVALVALALLGYVMRSSSTGSLRVDDKVDGRSAPAGPAIPPP